MQQIRQTQLQIGRISQADGRVIDPVGGNIKQRIASALGFCHAPGIVALFIVVIRCWALRSMLEPVENIGPDRYREQEGFIANIREVTADDHFRQIVQIASGNTYAAAGDGTEPQQHLAQRLLAMSENHEAAIRRDGQ